MKPPLRWGFIGAGENAQESLAPAVHASRRAVLQAVASRDPARARSLRPQGRTYERYQDLLDDPDVDAVYVGLANDSHHAWTLAAVRSGRPVLCEKPLSLSTPDIDHVIAAGHASGVAVTEACWYRWHPRIRAVQALLREGAIGSPRRLQACFASRPDPSGYRFDTQRGGGAVYDLGCYVVSAALWTFKSAPNEVSGTWAIGEGGVDVAACARLTFPNGVAELRVGFNDDKQTLAIEGDHGCLDVPSAPFTASGGKIKVTHDDAERVVASEGADTYGIMIDEVSSAFRGGPGWLLPLADSRACAAVIDAWRAVARRPSPPSSVARDRLARSAGC